MKKDISPEAKDEKITTLYRQNFNVMYRFVYRMTGNPYESEDIIQESFIKLLNSTRSLNEIKDPRGWIFRIVSNTCIEFLKRKKRYRKILDHQAFNGIGNQTSNSISQNPENNLAGNERMDLIRKAFNGVPMKHRLVLELSRQGLSYHEIASTLNIKTSSVGKKLFRAREKLRKELVKTMGNKS